MYLTILFQNDDYVAVDKPAGLLVHRTGLAADATEFALQLLHAQLRRPVFPCHRLDRPTSGVLLFALNRNALIHAQTLFAQNLCHKTYLAVVRGWIAEEINLDYALKNEEKPKQVQEAQTRFCNIENIELPFATGKYPQTRLSLVSAAPLTGRKHQIRRHLAHLRHPILGDTRHGDGTYNRLLRHLCGQNQPLLLRSIQLSLPLSPDAPPTQISVAQNSDWDRAITILGFQKMPIDRQGST